MARPMKGEPLTIHSGPSGQPGECLKVWDANVGFGHVYIELVDLTAPDEDDGSQPNIFLDKAGARELFNWLGVWLHTR